MQARRGADPEGSVRTCRDRGAKAGKTLKRRIRRGCHRPEAIDASGGHDPDGSLAILEHPRVHIAGQAVRLREGVHLVVMSVQQTCAQCSYPDRAITIAHEVVDIETLPHGGKWPGLEFVVLEPQDLAVAGHEHRAGRVLDQGRE